MSLFSRLFGFGGGAGSNGGSGPALPGESYAGYTITPDPVQDGSRWRIGARIEKEIDGEVMTHRMIRADTLEAQDAAAAASLDKAKMLIDQQGDAIFR